jgi:hypothetical protein
MGKTFTTTIEARCLKEHTCVCCGAVYAYPMARKVQGTAANAAQSAANAEAAVGKTLAREVDPEPCPTCGVLQPDMIGQRRARGLRWVFWLALVAFLLLIILCAAYVVPMHTAVRVGAALCAVAAVVLILIDLRDPNRNAEMNRQTAAGRVASGVVRHTPGKFVAGARELACFPRSVGHKLALVGLLAAVGLAAMPEVVRSSRGWPVNEDCYPPVVGPGDEARVYMTDKIQSVKGYWRGKPKAVARDAETKRETPLGAATNQNDWGSSISAKSSQKNTSSSPWVAVTMPAGPAVAGKAVDCAIDLNVEYPAMSGSSTFSTQRAHFSRTVPVRVAADPMAGAAYAGWWWKGTAGAMGVVLVLAQMLIWAAKRLEARAVPARVLPPAVVG